MKRPNYRSLQAFEAVSRHLSVSMAADELGITQSAVSHQLRQLTQELGERLLVKQGRGVALTVAGTRLAQKLQTAFADIERSVSEAIGGGRDVIRIAVCSSFAPGWLIPRLPRLYASNPVFDLQLLMYATDPELTDAVADAFVTTKPQEAGFASMLILPERLVPVCHASVRARFGDDLPLITTDLEPHRAGADWKRFAELSGETAPCPLISRWLFATHYLLALEMVRGGLGAALVPDFLVAREIADGSLALLGQACIETKEDYYFSVKESRKSEPGLDALSRWFRQEIARDRA